MMRSMPALAALLAAAPAVAAPTVAAAPPTVRAGDGWVRASLAGQRTGEAFVILTNTGRAPDRLLGGETPAAASVAPHHMATERGVMVMRRLDGVALPPGGRVRFVPGGDHLMLVGLRRPLRAGETLALTLRFQHAPPLRLTLPVRAAPAGGMAGMPGMGR